MLFAPFHPGAFREYACDNHLGKALACQNLRLYLDGDGRKVRRPPRSNYYHNHDDDLASRTAQSKHIECLGCNPYVAVDVPKLET